MIFGNRYKLKRTVLPDCISVDSQQFTRVDYFPYLGVTLDSEMNFEKALSDIIKRLSHKIFTMSTIRKDITTGCAVQLYKSMILPIADYSNFCLCACTEKLKTKLQRLQNRALRICFRANRYDRNFDLHVRAHLPTLELRRNFDTLKYIPQKDLLLDFTNVTISGIPEDNNPNSLPRTLSRSSPLINTDRPNSEKFRKSLIYSGCSLWNSLPPDLRNLADHKAFKASIERHLYQPYLQPDNVNAILDGIDADL